MADYLARRGLQTLLALFVLSIIAFALPRVGPGDPAVALYGADATAEDRQAVRHAWGLDRPVVEQYVTWLGNAVRGDLGASYHSGLSVTARLLERLPATALLAVTAVALGLLLGTALGLLCALNFGGALDRLGLTLASAACVAPGFWLGLLLIYLFAFVLGWLPAGGLSPADRQGTPLDYLAHLCLPALVLSLREAGQLALLLRAGLLDALAQPYARVAAAKGLPRLAVALRHAFPNAAISLVTVGGLALARLLAGAVTVETVFAWPGVGRLMVEAALSRDYPLMAGGVLLAGVIALAANLMVDLVYARVDPRIRLGRAVS